MTIVKPKVVLDFWFKLEPEQHFKVDTKLDKKIVKTFASTHKAASVGELFKWRKTPKGRLAEIIVLDQFSRNIYRGNPLAFASDSLALVLAQEAIKSGDDIKIPNAMRMFVYLPFMHSESRQIHIEAVKLFKKLGNQLSLEFELKHKDIIDRFGRYPHRNGILSRKSTSAELKFLKQPGSSF